MSQTSNESIVKIKTYMNEHSISTEELADELSVSSIFLQKILDNEYNFVDPEDIDHIYETILQLSNK